MLEELQQSRSRLKTRLRELASKLEGGMASFKLNYAETEKALDAALTVLTEDVGEEQANKKMDLAMTMLEQHILYERDDAKLTAMRTRRRGLHLKREHSASKIALAARCKDQPAGMPVYIGKPGLDVVLSPAYGNKTKEKKPRQKRKSVLRREEEEYYKRAKQQAQNNNMDEAELEKASLKVKQMYWRWVSMRDRDGYYIRRHLWSNRLRAYIVIKQHYQTGKCSAEIRRRDDESGFKAMLYLNTYEAASVYSIEAESKAMECLKGKVSDEQFKRYFCTGFLVERSKKSGLVYIFRRCRPILVFREKVHPLDEDSVYYYDHDPYYRTEHHFVAALCIHPQGYYSQSWAGTLVPTDDIVCQLLMMRTDEPKLWKKATQHDRFSPQADI